MTVEGKDAEFKFVEEGDSNYAEFIKRLRSETRIEFEVSSVTAEMNMFRRLADYGRGWWPAAFEYDRGGWNRTIYTFDAVGETVDAKTLTATYKIRGPIVPRRLGLWEWAKRRVRQWLKNK